MMKTVRLAARTGEWPLEVTAEEQGMEPSALPLPPAAMTRLRAWNEACHSLLRQESAPSASLEDDEDDADLEVLEDDPEMDELDKEGRRLWKLLRDRLDDSWTVIYESPRGYEMQTAEAMERVSWFYWYTERPIVVQEPEPNTRFACPCCGYLTLNGRGQHEICPLCGWEDDGQDDPFADQVWGGPNGGYSLAEARRNFRQYLTKRRPGDERGLGFQRTTRDEVIALKRELMSVCRDLAAAPDASAAAALIEQASDLAHRALMASR